MDKNKQQPLLKPEHSPVKGSVDGASKMKPVVGGRNGNGTTGKK